MRKAILIWLTAVCLGSLMTQSSCNDDRGEIFTPPVGKPGEPGQFSQLLPAPSALQPHQLADKSPMFQPEDLLREAEGFSLELPNNNALQSSSGVLLSPSFIAGSPLSATAYATYAFNIDGYNKNSEVRTEWIIEPSEPGSLWIGLSHWGLDTWRWFTPEPGSTAVFPNSMLNFIDDDGDLLVVVLLIGQSTAELDRLRVGSDPPVASFNVLGSNVGFAPFTATFDPSGSSDIDGEIVLYEWDPEGTGTFEISTSSPIQFGHLYETPGNYEVMLRVTDDSRLSSTATVTIAVGTTWVHTLGRADRDFLSDVAVTASGEIWACGTTETGNSHSDLLLLKYDHEGTLLHQLTWAVSLETLELNEGRSVVAAADGGAFVLGEYNSIELSRGTLLQRYDAEANLLWTKLIPHKDFGLFLRLLRAGNTLYMCGSRFISANEFGTAASFDIDGNLLAIRRTQQIAHFNDLDHRSAGFISNLAFCGEAKAGGKTDILFATVDESDFGAQASTWGTPGANESGIAMVASGGSIVLPQYAIAFRADTADEGQQQAGVVRIDRDDTTSNKVGIGLFAADILRAESFGLGLITDSTVAGVFLMSTDLVHNDDYCFSLTVETHPKCAANYGDAMVIAGGATLAGGSFDSEYGDKQEFVHNSAWTNMTLSFEVLSGEITDLSLPNLANQAPMVEDTGGGGGDDAWISMHLPPAT
jgi:PKD repeat protein